MTHVKGISGKSESAEDREIIANSATLFNLGAAITAVQMLPAYVTMNGRISTRDDVRKNSNTGVFEHE